MALTGNHVSGDTGHVADHNAIDAALAAVVPPRPAAGGTVTGPVTIATAAAGSSGQLLINDSSSNPGFTLGGDVTLFRSGASQLQTAQVFFIVRSTAGVAGLGITTSGDSTRRFQVNTDGKVLWSAGGAGTPPQDTTLSRDTSGGLKVVSTAGLTATPATPIMTVDASTGVRSSSPSSGGVLLVKVGPDPGAGLNVYASRSSAATGRLLNVSEGGTASPVAAVHVDYAGVANAVEINYTGTGNNGTTGPSTGQALNVVSSNQYDTTLGVDGHEMSRGTIKGVHNFPAGATTGQDSSASALSLRMNGTGTAAQGIFIDSDTGGTTGNILTLRNGGFANQMLTLDASGRQSVKGGLQVGSGTTPDFGGGVGVLGLSAAATVPTTNPASGNVVIYNDAGVLKTRDSTGTVAVLGSGGSTVVNPNWADQGLLGWSLDPAAASTSFGLTAGVIALAKVKTSGGTISNIDVYVSTAGSGLTSGQCFAALYSTGGTLLGQTADQSTTWASTGDKSMALTSAATGVPAGSVYVALLANGTTPPAFSCGAKTGAVNRGASAGAYRFASVGSAQTAMPSPMTMSGQSQLSAALVALVL